MWDTMNTSSGGLVFILDTLLQSEKVDIFQQMRVHLITEKFSLWTCITGNKSLDFCFVNNQQELSKRKGNPIFFKRNSQTLRINNSIRFISYVGWCAPFSYFRFLTFEPQSHNSCLTNILPCPWPQS